MHDVPGKRVHFHRYFLRRGLELFGSLLHKETADHLWRDDTKQRYEEVLKLFQCFFIGYRLDVATTVSRCGGFRGQQERLWQAEGAARVGGCPHVRGPGVWWEVMPGKLNCN